MAHSVRLPWQWVGLLVGLGSLVDMACSHAYLAYPPFRGMNKTQDDYLRSAYNGLAGWGTWTNDSVCGDGGQSTSQGSPALWTFGQRGAVTVLQAGSTVTFKVVMRAAHYGRYEFRICTFSGAETTATLNQTCLDRRVLQPAPGQAQVIAGQPWWWVGNLPAAPEYSMQYVIPSDVSCDGVSTFCVLQFQYTTGNSCNPSGTCPETSPANCKPAGWFNTCQISPPTGEYFRNCADVIIQPGTSTPAVPSGPTSPPPVVAPSAPVSNPIPSPPPAVSSSPPPLPAGNSSSCCNAHASGNWQNPANCSQFCMCQNFQVLAIQSCSPGLLFNNAMQSCDWPQNVQCSPQASPSPSPSPSPSLASSPPPAAASPPPSPKASPTPQSPPSPAALRSSPPPSATPSPPVPLQCCTGYASGYHQNRANCSQFCLCSNSQLLALQSCPPGLLFSETSQVCDWPQNVLCPAPASPSPTALTPPSPTALTSPPPLVTVLPSPQATTPPQSPATPTNAQVVAYWGQNGNEGTLLSACQSGRYDIIVMGFLYIYGQGQAPRLNLAGHCDPASGGCVGLSSEISTCQSLGRKVILSMGGAVGNYGFSSDSDAQAVAQYVWQAFLGGSSPAVTRPLGAAAVDGIDLDIEGGGPAGYAAFLTALRSLMDQSGKKYFISGAPQCPFPDALMGPSPGTALGSAPVAFDYVWVQFYNNYCQFNGNANNLIQAWNQWSSWMAGANPSMRLFLGVPGSASAAGSGYMNQTTLRWFLGTIKGYANYGGVMIWDVYNDINNSDANNAVKPFSAGIRPYV